MFRNVLKQLRQNICFKSIQNVIALVFSCLIVFIIAIMGFLSYYVTGMVVERYSAEYVMQLVKQVNYDIQYYLDNVETISKNLSYNVDIKKFLEGDNSIQDVREISQYLDTFVRSRSDILNIFVFTEDGRMIANRDNVKFKTNVDFKREPWYMKAIQADELIISSSHVQNIIEGQYKWVVSCSRALTGVNTMKKLGVLLIDLNFDLIHDMCSKIELGKKGYVFILDLDGNIVYHPKQQLLYSNLKHERIDLILNSSAPTIMVEEEGLRKQYIITSSPYSGWKVVGVVYMDDISDYKSLLERFFLGLGVVSLAISVLCSVLISRHFSRPIKELANIMNQVKDGNFDVSINIKSDNEIGELGRTFNYMVQEIKNLIKQIKLEQKQKRLNELKALQAQINPHFLYNTLDSIIWMAEAKKYEEVIKMTSSLARLFRISISKGREFITVREEIEHVKNYLTIQQIRYPHKFDYEISVDPVMEKYRIVKLILQPIVENAIYHGIRNMEGMGKIIITGQQKGDKLVFEVKDNGIGMDEETLCNLFNRNYYKESRLSGVGIRNVDERIKLYYGAEYGIQIESRLLQGTTVRIYVPIEKAEEDGT